MATTAPLLYGGKKCVTFPDLKEMACFLTKQRFGWVPSFANAYGGNARWIVSLTGDSSGSDSFDRLYAEQNPPPAFPKITYMDACVLSTIGDSMNMSSDIRRDALALLEKLRPILQQ